MKWTPLDDRLPMKIIVRSYHRETEITVHRDYQKYGVGFPKIMTELIMRADKQNRSALRSERKGRRG